VANGLARRLREWGDRNFVALLTSLFVLTMLVLYFAPNIFVTIPAGHGGALWLRFFGGTAVNFYYGEGTKIIFPWDKIYLYDLRIQQQTANFDVLTSEGLEITVDVTLRFRLKPNSIGAITAYAGPDFVKTLVMPSVGAMVRLEAAKHTAEAIYSTERHAIENDIFNEMGEVVDNLIPASLHPGSEIILLDFWFRSIKLPPDLQRAIEQKLTQRQLAEQYRYILEREEREKQRKRIEAEGIKAFQDTVSSGITDSYLRWKGIDATLKLAESPNSKIVIVGGGKEGLPLILGPWEGQGAQPLKPGDQAPAKAGEATPVTPETPSSATGGVGATRPSSAAGGLRELPSREPPGMPPAPLATQPGISVPTVSPQQSR
jgi:prohibitin 2